MLLHVALGQAWLWPLQEGDILVVAQKILSGANGRMVPSIRSNLAPSAGRPGLELDIDLPEELALWRQNQVRWHRPLKGDARRS